MTKPFRIMKGEPVDMALLRLPVWQFPKFNGFRFYVKGGVVYTSSNSPFRNVHVQAWFKDCEDFDGEFVVGDPADCHNSLEKTSSVVSSADKPINDLRAYVFDHIGDLSAPFADRYAKLEHLPGIEAWKQHKVLRAPYWVANSAAEVVARNKQLIDAGWEGTITRDPEAPYKCGKSTAKEATMGKLKNFTDGEFLIVGWEERMHNGNEATTSATGRTKRSSAKAGKVGRGDLGSFELETKEGNRFNCGTGFTDKQRADYWAVKEQLVALREYAKIAWHATGTKDVPLIPTFLQIRPKWDMTTDS